MAELVDALVSGTSIRKYVQVRVLFWAQKLHLFKVRLFLCEQMAEPRALELQRK